jgi:type VI protein secretion system component VasF
MGQTTREGTRRNAIQDADDRGELVEALRDQIRDLRGQLEAERARRYQAERERDELRRELEEIQPRGRPWWVLGLLVIVVVTTIVVLSLGAIISPP